MFAGAQALLEGEGPNGVLSLMLLRTLSTYRPRQPPEQADLAAIEKLAALLQVCARHTSPCCSPYPGNVIP